MFIYGINGRTWVEAPDEGGGGGGGGGDDQADKVLAGIQSLLKRHGGDAGAVAQMLYQENKQYRDTIADLRTKLPAEGAVILSAEDAALWASYQALGKPAELQAAIEDRTQLQGKLEGLERDGLLRSVAEVAGYKPAVLSNLDRMATAQGKALAYELKEQSVDGKPVKVAYVKDGDNQTPLAEYAATQWADFMPALVVAAQGNGNGSQQPGVRFPVQGTGGGAAVKTDMVSTFLTEQNEKAKAVKNPLLKG